ncbi:MAG: M48 family metallopeptidase [Flavobacteriia bacterium]|nr:M48 family metallopeptidase [Flavobacteriia bacterium]
MYFSKAIYYDGLTSTPHPVELKYDENKNDISFVTADKIDHSWLLFSCIVEIKPHLLRISSKDNTGQQIKVEDLQFIYHFNRLFQEGKVSWYTRLLRMNFLKWILFISGFMVLIISLYMLFLPVLSDALCSVIPKDVDNEIGEKSLNSFLSDYEIDSNKTVVLNQYLREIKTPKNNKFKIIVVKSKEINAFALPNGSIVIFSEMLNKIKHSSQLNALLGHEISHVTHRHSMRSLCKNMFTYLWISLLFSDVSTVQTILAENAYTLQSLSFSREFEKEADFGSIDLLRQNGLPVEGIIELMQIISVEQKSSIPQFLSTHPMGNKRIEYNKKEIGKLKPYMIQEKKVEKLNEIWGEIQK